MSQVLGPNNKDKLGNDFTVQDVVKFILSVKNNEATGCDDIPTESWKLLVTDIEGTKILLKLLNMIRREFPKNGKLC